MYTPLANPTHKLDYPRPRMTKSVGKTLRRVVSVPSFPRLFLTRKNLCGNGYGQRGNNDENCIRHVCVPMDNAPKNANRVIPQNWLSRTFQIAPRISVGVPLFLQ